MAEGGTLSDLKRFAQGYLGGFSLNSLAWRLILATALWSILVSTIATIALVSIYREEAQKAFDIRLDDALLGLMEVSISPDSNVPVVPRAYGTNQYNSPLSGYYWQVTPSDGAQDYVQTSQSLVGERLAFPEAGARPHAALPNIMVAEITDYDGARLKILSNEYAFPAEQGGRRFTFLVTASLKELEGAISSFRWSLELAQGLLGLGIVGALIVLIRWGLWPLRQIEAGLTAIRTGEKGELEGEMPDEIRPLQREINALIKSNHDIVERARTHVGNLAHALKTPLSVLSNEAKAGAGPLAQKVAEQVEFMRDQVTHHLDRARMVARVGVIGDLTEVKPVAEGLARTLEKIYGRDRDMSVSAECPDGVRFQGERQDLEEMLGNLMDNACKWARSEVTATIEVLPRADRTDRTWLAITVDDDGPGLTPDERAAAVQRGQRLDESKPGSGLGLSIVSDLIGLYGGTFELAPSPSGGLRARLTLPGA